MPTQFDMDTNFVKFLFTFCIILVLFSMSFIAMPYTMGLQNKNIQHMGILFLMLLILLIGFVFGIFVKWFVKYKNSLIRPY
ncbi:MAG: hypothetical protein JW700_00255 [Candidatus Aenigmarchaeota archaeon]|nr:hypothetical protein [Candidatus Aenigmarchaeota archaeon]